MSILFTTPAPPGGAVLVDEQLEVDAAGLIVLAVVDVAGPCLAPDLDEDAVLGALEVGEHERLAVPLLGAVGVVEEREAVARVERHVAHVLLVRRVLSREQIILIERNG